MRTRRIQFNLALAIGLAVVISAGQTNAQTTRTFKVSGKGNIPELPLSEGATGKHTAKGVATYLGRYEGNGEAYIGPLIDPANPFQRYFKSNVPFEFRGARRSLKFDYGVGANGKDAVGVVTLMPVPNKPFGHFVAVWDAMFVLTERSGKVVGGKFRMIATTDPFSILEGLPKNVKYKWEGEGTITFANGRRDK